MVNLENKPFIIAGPCSVESEFQIMDVALALAKIPQVKLLRGGIWKPRTRPGGFEGRGEEGLAWLSQAGRESGLPTATEVATPEHVEAALKYGVRALWIGARTVVNPFSVQQIADALGGANVTVFVKNPLAPDLKLWIGAFERLRKAGVANLAAVHRGFQYYKETQYRNYPMWEIAIELTRLAGVPLITDVSHICGRRDLLFKTAQKAADMAADGLMVEVHPSPDDALTDAQQQITPDGLDKMLQNIIWRSKTGIGDQTLVGLRAEIDDIDAELLRLLAHRMELSRSIGHLKREKGLSAYQPDRWNKILTDHISEGKLFNLGEELVTEVFDAIHKASIDAQTDILGEEEKENQL